MVVVVVEPALADGDGSPLQLRANRAGIVHGVERRRVVRMHTGREVDEPRMRARDLTRAGRGGQRLADGDDRGGTGGAGARDHVTAIGVERGIGKVSVRVEKTHSPVPWKAPDAARLRRLGRSEEHTSELQSRQYL